MCEQTCEGGCAGCNDGGEYDDVRIPGKISDDLPKKNVMIDLETLGTKPGCFILSIGACTFGDGPAIERAKFYTTIGLQSQANAGLEIDTDTLSWWVKQDTAVMREAFSGTEDIKAALISFSLWLHSLNVTPVVWGNAASFDLKILEAAYDACGLEVPWSHRNEMCFRTLKKVFDEIDEPTFFGDKHNALADAIHQAVWAERMLHRKVDYEEQTI